MCTTLAIRVAGSAKEGTNHKLHYKCLVCQTATNISNITNATDVRQHCGSKTHVIGMQVCSVRGVLVVMLVRD